MADTKIEDFKEEEVTEEEVTMVGEEEATMDNEVDEEGTVHTLETVTFLMSVTIAKRCVGINGLIAQSERKTKGEPMEMAATWSILRNEMALNE